MDGICDMTKLLEKAIAEIRKLRPERQEDAAAMLFTIVEQEESNLRLSPEQLEEVKLSLREADAGLFVEQKEIKRLFKKYGA